MQRMLGSAATFVFFCLTSVSGPAAAQSAWEPTTDVEFVVPFVAGGGADILARTIVQVMADEKLVKVPVQVSNRGGGGTAVGLSYVLANRTGNPNTLVLIASTTQTNHIVVPEAPGLESVVPVYNFMVDDFVLITRADAPWKDARELMEAAKGQPPKSINAGSGGSPTASDSMAIDAFGKAAGIEFNVVHFNGGSEVVPALLGGHVDISSSNPAEYVGHLKAGAVRFLGVMRDERFAQLPDVMTMKEQGIDARPPQIWRGVAIPKDSPPEAIAFWEGVMEKVAASKAIQDLLENNLASPHPLKGEELKAYIAEQEGLIRSFLGK